MDNVKKWYEGWQIIAGVLSVLAVAVGYIYTQGQESRSMEGRTFDSPEQKVETIYHIRSVPTPDKLREKAIFDSIQISEIKELLIKNSKADNDIKKHIHHIDSINLLNADQMYQIKKELKIKN